MAGIPAPRVLVLGLGTVGAGMAWADIVVSGARWESLEPLLPLAHSPEDLGLR